MNWRRKAEEKTKTLAAFFSLLATLTKAAPEHVSVCDWNLNSGWNCYGKHESESLSCDLPERIDF